MVLAVRASAAAAASLASPSASVSSSSSVNPRRQGLAAGGEDLDERSVDDLLFVVVRFFFLQLGTGKKE